MLKTALFIFILNGGIFAYPYQFFFLFFNSLQSIFRLASFNDQFDLQQLEVKNYKMTNPNPFGSGSTGGFNMFSTKNNQKDSTNLAPVQFSLAQGPGESQPKQSIFAGKSLGTQPATMFGTSTTNNNSLFNASKAEPQKSMFGGTGTGILFGSNTSSTATVTPPAINPSTTSPSAFFGSTSSTPFGAPVPANTSTATTSLYGKTASTPFGGINTNTGSMFEQKNNDKSIFGKKPDNSLFGQKKQGSIPFGLTNSASTVAIFGPPKQQNIQPKKQIPTATGAGLFNPSSKLAPTPFPATNSSAAGGLFSASINTPTPGLFGNSLPSDGASKHKKSHEKLQKSRISSDGNSSLLNFDTVKNQPGKSFLQGPSKLDNKDTIKLGVGPNPSPSPAISFGFGGLGGFTGFSSFPTQTAGFLGKETQKKPEPPKKNSSTPPLQTQTKRRQQNRPLTQDQKKVITQEIEGDIKRGRQLASKAQLQKKYTGQRNLVKKELIEKLKNQKNWTILDNQKNLYDDYILGNIKKLHQQNQGLQQQKREKQQSLRSLKSQVERLQNIEAQSRKLHIELPKLPQIQLSIKKQQYSDLLKQHIPDEDIVKLYKQYKKLEKQSQRLQKQIECIQNQNVQKQTRKKQKQHQLLTIKHSLQQIIDLNTSVDTYCLEITKQKLALQQKYTKMKQQYKKMKKMQSQPRYSLGNSLIR